MPRSKPYSVSAISARTEASRRWAERNPEKRKALVREQNLKKYGLTGEDYRQLLEGQDCRCAICRTDTPRGHGSFHVDHDHQTGRVRGLLCHSCNTALGGFKDSIELLEAARRYLDA